MAQDARNFIFSTDNTLPTYSKIVTCQVTTIPNKTATVQVDTGLDYTPLIMGMWSVTQDFSRSYDITVDGFVDNISDIYVQAVGSKIVCSVYSGYTKTVYFKLYCMIPPDANETIAPVPDTSSFFLSTDYDYLQVRSSGYVTLKGLPTGVHSIEVNHSLGYIPKFRVWTTSSTNGVKTVSPTNSSIYEMYTSPYVNIELAIANDQSLVLTNFLRNAVTDENVGYYYQIYTEEA